jgi:hypothetical protein
VSERLVGLPEKPSPALHVDERPDPIEQDRATVDDEATRSRC